MGSLIQKKIPFFLQLNGFVDKYQSGQVDTGQCVSSVTTNKQEIKSELDVEGGENKVGDTLTYFLLLFTTLIFVWFFDTINN